MPALFLSSEMVARSNRAVGGMFHQSLLWVGSGLSEQMNVMSF